MAERPLSTISGETMLAIATNTPLPLNSDDSSIREPRAPYMAVSDPFISGSDSPRESYLNATPNDSGALLANKNENYADEPIPTTTSPTKSKRRTVIIALLSLLALILVIVAVIVPVYFTVIKPKSRSVNANASSGGSNGPTSTGPSGSSTPPSSSTNVITGGDGSTIKAADGSTFTYNNKFGGFCECFSSHNLKHALSNVLLQSETVRHELF